MIGTKWKSIHANPVAFKEGTYEIQKLTHKLERVEHSAKQTVSALTGLKTKEVVMRNIN